MARRIALKYHQLGGGYYELPEEEGAAPRLVAPDATSRAALYPPRGGCAERRWRFIRESAGARAAVGWERARVGGFFRARLVRLDPAE